jgi:hypothetical protein
MGGGGSPPHGSGGPLGGGSGLPSRGKTSSGGEPLSGEDL